MKLAGKVALVTGSSRGIGAASAIRLAEDGADIAIVHSNSADAAAKVAEKIRSLGRRAEVFKVNMADVAATQKLVGDVVKAFGRLDILVNNAGTYSATTIDQTSLEEFNRVMDINVQALFVLCKEAAEHLPTGGRIINIGSCLGELAPFPGLSAYSTSKFAVAGLTRALARDLGAKGVLVNNIQPGPINTEMNPETSEYASVQAGRTCLGRFGKPDEIAAAVAFLASPEASYITGAMLNVDGGFNA